MKKVTNFFDAVFALLCAAVIFWLRLSEPEMTEAQLFLRFWYLFLAIPIAYLLASAFVEWLAGVWMSEEIKCNAIFSKKDR